MTSDMRQKAYIQPARCLKHSQCDRELFYCFNCNRVCCAECRKEIDEHLQHSAHKTSLLAQFLAERRDRMTQIKAQIAAHESHRSDFLHELEGAKKSELEKGFCDIEQLVDRLRQQVDLLAAKLKAVFKQQAELVWAEAPHAALVGGITRANEEARTLRETLEHEMRRAELDELQMAEGSRELDALADRLVHSMRHDVPLPAVEELELSDLRRTLADAAGHFEAALASARDKLLTRVAQAPAAARTARTPTLVEAGIIEGAQLKTASDRLDPYVLGVIRDECDSLLVVDGWNACIKSLNLSSGAECELYYGPPNVEMAGLFSTPVNSTTSTLFTVEVERPKGIETWDTSRVTRLLVFRREKSAQQLTLWHKETLPEKTRWLNVTIAALPNGNALVGVIGFTRVYEVDFSDSHNARLALSLRPYQLPGAYRCICGFRVCDRWHLAASFDDDTVRVFSFSGSLLEESCRLALASSVLRPFRIVDLCLGGLLVRSEAPSASDCAWTTYLDLFPYDARGLFSGPSRLLERKGILIPLAVVPPRAQTRGSKPELVSLDHDSKALRFFDIVQ